MTVDIAPLGPSQVYFGTYPSHLAPGRIAHSLADKLSALSVSTREKTGRLPHASTVLSEFLGWAQKTHTPTDNDKPLVAMATAYSNLLADLSIAMETQWENMNELVEPATINQQLAASIYLVGMPNAPKSTRESARFFLQTAEALTQESGVGQYALHILAASRAQAWLMHTLDREGWTVLVPDFRKSDEILEWDVKRGIDIAAVDPSRKKVVFLDTKSRRFDHTTPTTEIQTELQCNHLPPPFPDAFTPIVNQMRRHLGITTPRILSESHFKVRIPTHQSLIGEFGEARNPALLKTLIQNIS